MMMMPAKGLARRAVPATAYGAVKSQYTTSKVEILLELQRS